MGGSHGLTGGAITGGGAPGGGRTGASGGAARAGAESCTITCWGGGAGATFSFAKAPAADCGVAGPGAGASLGACCGAGWIPRTAGGGATVLGPTVIASAARSKVGRMLIAIAMASVIIPTTKTAVSELPTKENGVRRSCTSTSGEEVVATSGNGA